MGQFTSCEFEFSSAVAKGQEIGLKRTCHWGGDGARGVEKIKGRDYSPLQMEKSWNNVFRQYNPVGDFFKELDCLVYGLSVFFSASFCF